MSNDVFQISDDQWNFEDTVSKYAVSTESADGKVVSTHQLSVMI